MMTHHESAVGHVTGTARYSDEIPETHGTLSAWPVQAPHAHARLLGIDISAAAKMPGVHAVLTATDIPGANQTGPIIPDEPLLPDAEISYFGQAIAWVLADSESQARQAAALVTAQYEPLPAVLTYDAAEAAQSYHLKPSVIERGDPVAALAAAAHSAKGRLDVGGQDHFYLETHSCRAEFDADGQLILHASTQHPTETQHIVAHVLNLPAHRVTCRCIRMGGGFGGKETQANGFAAICAIGAQKTGRPVRLKLHRSQDMQLTGKRHPFRADYDVGFDADGRIEAAIIDLVADAGWSVDLSPPVLMRAMVHVDNAYFLPNVRVQGRMAKTNLPSNTAFRGFGGPQGMIVAEEMIAAIAATLNLPADVVRERNFYRGANDAPRNQTHYGQAVIDNELPELWAALKDSADFSTRRAAIESFNAAHPHQKRGLAITPVKFGISFNKTIYNQAGALVQVYHDGSIQLNHGGTEMGQGLHSKMIVVASRVLGVNPERIRVMVTSTEKVPNTSATAASSGSDLNGHAVADACNTLLSRLRPVAAAALQVHPEHVEFAADGAQVRGEPERRLSFEKLIHLAYDARISLSAAGYYFTPEIHWDPIRLTGRPFYYYAFGAAVAEVEVCGHTGIHQLRRVDLLHDVGNSLHELIDRGQIEGGFVQGMGWLTSEELCTNAQGRLLTDAPSTYKIPSLGEVPTDFRVQLYARRQPATTATIFGSKGVGEPPFMLALSVREALRDAVSAFAPIERRRFVDLAAPATPEAIWRAVTRVRPDLAET
ncbi:xanthine dehydrogenase molybdopterin binding subunit [Ahniella affigens]|uniref:Xanthine dehydrogenase molybdopterin binding subunit n=1 Tax=Ahniella affigens TaxID=2021234 RepID=A0A2P1PT64_9GAMM|nr:xanthine dehydrogenase molybdopterin binding subunit [Ahniella affigens]AVP98021.1 xanthine dehydrogenase molybdopterin binding subunit [Ahniella affigens]